jgi:Ca2+-binding EF-hand superfamily protein
MLAFVFRTIDTDNDGHISKSDLFRFLMQYRADKKLSALRVFPTNLTRAVELFNESRGDRMNTEKFCELNNFMPYVSFPAFRL